VTTSFDNLSSNIKKIDLIKILIFFSFCVAVISLSYNLKNYDKIKFSNNTNQLYHVMIKSDPLKYLSHGNEIKENIKNGINYFKTGQQNFTKYLPARLAASYYYFFGYDLFNNSVEKKINTGIHYYYLLIQCAIYYFSIFFLYSSFQKKIPQKICLFIVLFLSLEPTIFQYHGTFWTESIFFSLQLLLLSCVIRNNNNSLNFFFIGLFLGFLSIQRSPAFLYIIPILIYFIIFLKKEIYPKISFILIGYLLVLLFVGYHNYIRANVFYFVPNDTRSNVSRYLIPNIIDKEKQLNETKLATDWIKNNQIQIKNDKASKDIYNLKPYVFCEELYILNEKDRLKYCNYLKSRTMTLLFDNPLATTKYIFKKTIQTILLDPFHIYSEHNFDSKESYIKSPTNQKLISARIFYTIVIFFVSFIGLFQLYKIKDKRIFTLFILSAIYFFIATSWNGNPRYFIPVLIYISLFFGSGCAFLLNIITKKLYAN
jgi:hypothetical protein